MSAGSAPARDEHRHLAEDGQTEALGHLVGSDEPPQRGRSQGGEDRRDRIRTRWTPPPPSYGGSSGWSGARAVPSWDRTRTARVIAVGHFHDAGGRRVGVGLGRGGSVLVALIVTEFEPGSPDSRDRHRHVADTGPAPRSSPPLRSPRSSPPRRSAGSRSEWHRRRSPHRCVLRRRLCQQDARWPRNASPAPPRTQKPIPTQKRKVTSATIQLARTLRTICLRSTPRPLSQIPGRRGQRPLHTVHEQVE